MNTFKESKILNLLKQCEIIALSSHDMETKVGSILVDKESQAQLSTGYNGFVRGVRDELLPNKRPNKYEYILHSEQNLITNAARLGIKTQDAISFQTLSPCFSCARLLYQSGIKEIYFTHLYSIYNKERMIEVTCENFPTPQYRVELQDLTLIIIKFNNYYKMNIFPTIFKIENNLVSEYDEEFFR